MGMLVQNIENTNSAIADTNWLINILDHSGSCRRAKKGLRAGPKRVVIPQVVINELQKIRRISSIEILHHVSAILRKKVCILKCNSDIRLAAKELETKYPHGGRFKGYHLILNKAGSGSSVPKWYNNKEYDKIIEYVIDETTSFTNFYNKIFHSMFHDLKNNIFNHNRRLDDFV